jgi:signal transduction histidine kinase/CheY-like chemotaxis protein
MGRQTLIPLIRWVLITASIVMMANSAIMWKVIQASVTESRADYAIFQNDLFQQGVFINRTIRTLHQIMHEGFRSTEFKTLKKKLDTYTRAILGHQTINLQIYLKVVSRLPDDDPLLIRQQIQSLRPRLLEYLDYMTVLNLQLNAAGSMVELAGLISEQTDNLERFMKVMNDSINLHSQIESSFFNLLKTNHEKTTKRLTFSLNLLLFLIGLIGVSAALYLLEQARHGRMLKKAKADLEVKVQARTQELLAANSRLQSQVNERQEKLASQAKLRFILDSLPDMILELDGERRILWANRTALESNPQAIGQSCYRAFPGKDTPCEGCLCRRAFDTGRLEMGTVHQAASKTASESYWEVIGVPLKDAAGEVVSVLEVARNVTERELARQRELRLQNDLAHAHKMESIGTLAGGVAHDINNILSIVIGNTELLTDEVSDADQDHLKEYLDEILRAGLRARDVVHQLLAFSRQDDEHKYGVVDIEETVQRAMRLIRSTTPANIRIEVQITGPIAPIYGNANQIGQLLINLCANAKDAVMDTSGSITLRLRNAVLQAGLDDDLPSLTPGNYVELSVRDNGHGMNQATLAKIFDPYFTTKAFGQGSGIGLSVVHGIVNRHGGKIRVDSEPGKGTTVTVLLAAHKSQTPSHPEPAEALRQGRERILLVDDEPAIRRLGKQHLEKLGYRVTCAADPLEALALFTADIDAFDLIITDMAMPHMSGVQLATEILKIQPHMPIILCTGYSEGLSEEKALNIGVADFALKPLDRTDLAWRVRKVLNNAYPNRSA